MYIHVCVFECVCTCVYVFECADKFGWVRLEIDVVLLSYLHQVFFNQ